MKLAIYWTEASIDHIARHNVDPGEVEEAVEHPYWTFDGKGGVTVLLGRTYAGRYLTVILADCTAVEDAHYVATAREMTASEKRTFTRKVR